VSEQQVSVVQGNTSLGTAGMILSILSWFTCGIVSPIAAIVSFAGLFGKGKRDHAIIGLVVGFPGTIFMFLVTIPFLLGGAAVTVGGVPVATSKATEHSPAEIASNRKSSTPSETDTRTFGEKTVDALFGGNIKKEREAKERKRIEDDQNAENNRIAEEERLRNIVVENERLRVIQLAKEKAELMDLEKIIEAHKLTKPAEIPGWKTREWKSLDGKYKVEATLLKAEYKSATLVKRDLSRVTLDKAKLSVEDQLHLESCFYDVELHNRKLNEYEAKLDSLAGTREKLASSIRTLSVENVNLATPRSHEQIAAELVKKKQDKLIGTWYWRCPSKRQSEWRIEASLLQDGLVYKLTEKSTGNSQVPDSVEEFGYTKEADLFLPIAKANESEVRCPFKIDSNGDLLKYSSKIVTGRRVVAAGGDFVDILYKNQNDAEAFSRGRENFGTIDLK